MALGARVVAFGRLAPSVGPSLPDIESDEGDDDGTEHEQNVHHDLFGARSWPGSGVAIIARVRVRSTGQPKDAGGVMRRADPLSAPSTGPPVH